MRPLLLDCFCGAGGAAKGYHDAGFDIIGIDIKMQKRYPYAFIQDDALCALAALAEDGMYQGIRLSEIAAIHASPPCQDSSVLKHLNKHKTYPQLIPQTRTLLKRIGLPYVIENVPGAPLIEPFLLCGSMFGLRTDCGAELRRHRLFETNWEIGLVPQCQHFADAYRPVGISGTGLPMTGTRMTQRVVNVTERRTVTVTGHSPMDGARRTIGIHGDHARDPNAERRRYRTISITGATPQQNVVRDTIRETFPVEQARKAMGIDWMPMKDLSQAIPPAYTRWIGLRLMEHLR